jgi:hypothetical protein
MPPVPDEPPPLDYARPPDRSAREKRLLPWIALEWLVFVAMLAAAQFTLDPSDLAVLSVSAGVLLLVMLWQVWRAAGQ